MSGELEFEQLVARYYEPLYQFAYSLTRDEADACDLTQQTFYVWASKGHQLRDSTKVKTWLFTTLHRQFLEIRRKAGRFAHADIESMEVELPPIVTPIEKLDAPTVLQALAGLDEVFRAPVALFYLQDCAYREIAEILDIPMGTVKSRIARGIGQLQRSLADDFTSGPRAEGGAS